MMLGVCHIADGDNLPDKEAADGLSDLNVRCSHNMRITSELYMATRTFTLQPQIDTFVSTANISQVGMSGPNAVCTVSVHTGNFTVARPINIIVYRPSSREQSCYTSKLQQTGPIQDLLRFESLTFYHLATVLSVSIFLTIL